MGELVSALEKRRYATKERLPQLPEESEAEPEPAVHPSACVPTVGEARADPHETGEFSRVPSSGNPRQRGRYTPAEVRRSVRERDGTRCAYVDANGRRCSETSFLEVHHRDPFARGGPATRSNLTIYCRSHNALAAEQDFGCAHIDRENGR